MYDIYRYCNIIIDYERRQSLFGPHRDKSVADYSTWNKGAHSSFPTVMDFSNFRKGLLHVQWLFYPTTVQ